MKKLLVLSKGHFLNGLIVRLKSKNTIVVKIKRLIHHKKYRKVLSKSTMLLVHNDGFFCFVGDRVLIKECSPISKRKSFILVDVLFKNIVV